MDLPTPAWARQLPPEAVQAATEAWSSQPSTSVPTPDLIFAAFDACPPERVRVVILGQDPYPTPGHAMGLSFSVPGLTNPLPPSLRNIFTELQRTHGSRRTSGDLRSWATQGVLLLNRWLTLTEDRRLRRSWDTLTRAVLTTCATKLPQPVVIVSWGRPAIELVTDCTGWSAADVTPNRRWLRSSHPSPLGARRGCLGAPAFVGCGHFREIDEFIAPSGQQPIDWFTPNHPTAHL